MNTAQRRMYLYIKLLDNQTLSKKDLAQQFQVSERAIQRDVSQLKAFFAEAHLPQMVYYDKKNNGYHLISDQHQLNHQEILVLIKILLASRALNTTELTKTITGLLNLVHSEDKKQVEPLIKNELFYYQPLQHQQDLLNKVWSLSQTIITKQPLEIIYQRQHAETVTRQVLPQALIFSEYYFYLVSFNPKYQSSLLYRVDRIIDFKPTNQVITRDYKDRFQEGDFRQKIQFMYPGQLTHVKFQFWGIVEAALDRLPTAKVTARFTANSNQETPITDSSTRQPEKGGSVVIEADVYGEHGIMMWLLSQGSNVKVLGPQSLVENIKKEASAILRQYGTNLK